MSDTKASLWLPSRPWQVHRERGGRAFLPGPGQAAQDAVPRGKTAEHPALQIRDAKAGHPPVRRFRLGGSAVLIQAHRVKKTGADNVPAGDARP